MEPFIKWAGGKRWLVSDSAFSLPRFSGRYIEPFLGGGAVFFHLQPDAAILSDLNVRLIEVYQAIRNDWKKVQNELYRLQKKHSREFYYQERSRKRLTKHTRAAQFIYLNRTCWNGLYRENSKGQFNVPIGTKNKVIMDNDDFKMASDILSRADVSANDFEHTMSQARDGDLIFLDPPYTTAHNLNGFLKYNQKIFSWDDQVRLKKCISLALDRGAKVILTNADHSSLHELYNDIAKIKSLERFSRISGKSAFRKITSESLFLFE
ncbi:DNA adenine methylase [Vreelandella malpeensis]|uniref:Site-specific DNA-methyltransferase (adenine-specific) n=1 Tax=Vreelandella malpeensis TaxID=1172368 RepID=A0ABS8DNS3_9GAMM|nr:Dam family site-specific DNA-(adenine-N6)-methyltransferase [Halomonas malpeensis]MCB8887954.1 Dam family site-specific DNA-(adenine-N6)-methyltransferase [Halomonas malpeensis]